MRACDVGGSLMAYRLGGVSEREFFLAAVRMMPASGNTTCRPVRSPDTTYSVRSCADGSRIGYLLQSSCCGCPFHGVQVRRVLTCQLPAHSPPACVLHVALTPPPNTATTNRMILMYVFLLRQYKVGTSPNLHRQAHLSQAHKPH